MIVHDYIDHIYHVVPLEYPIENVPCLLSQGSLLQQRLWTQLPTGRHRIDHPQPGLSRIRHVHQLRLGTRGIPKIASWNMVR